ncbi:CidA/LrgA family protein [Alicyclobacillus pomorum]|uniref:CidA/LrgA family protein n=1 Tax=Alicyclobacillus pomorum TaxID=204470 RepID=UPI000406D292|nr:CidA/LrgA family holin-like protein [Alicyclobacillus pomorum]
MKIVRVALQISLLTALSMFGNWVSGLTHLPIPGSIVGLILLFALLQLRMVKLQWVEVGGNWLISNMLLFFVPSALGIIQYGSLVKTEGLQLVLVIGMSTAAVMITTGLFAEKFTQWKRKGEKQRALTD